MENVNVNYDTEVIDFFGKDTIAKKYEFVLKSMKAFLKLIDSNDLIVNETILKNVIIEYFKSVDGLKSFHTVNWISEQKDYAYLSYWLLKYKPIQITKTEVNKDLIFINEKYVASIIISLITKENDFNGETFDDFIDLLLFNFKYRDISANAIELLITSFKAGIGSQQ